MIIVGSFNEEGKINRKKVYSSEELRDQVFNTVEYLEQENQRLRDHNNELYEKARQLVSKDYEKEIQILKNELEYSYGSFNSDEERQAYINFNDEHLHNRLTSKAQAGKRIYFIPTDTGFGRTLEAVCPICGAKKDITDRETWG